MKQKGQERKEQRKKGPKLYKEAGPLFSGTPTMVLFATLFDIVPSELDLRLRFRQRKRSESHLTLFEDVIASLPS